VNAAKLEIECAKHGSCFSLTSGEPNSMPATRATPVYTVRIDDDAVYVEID
jgi:3-phenylpropionate/trans-cinnamate dioxygenase ferredoxin subunit